ncbi:MAG: GH3 auxin-responsive promoter family protein [Theionarchaea archaeon]|nr:GH3 auxin-responsive promoter family protein [Theionarchaea archaeon]MBU7036591.1 GH3 auxin-responsive promoter family protein [Theionarchaea archaeon]
MNTHLLQRVEKLAGDDSALEHAEKVQEQVLRSILKANRNTVFGKDHSFCEIDSIESYQKRLPLARYDDFRLYLELMKAGVPHILLAEDFPRWAETSGTLSSPKLYPIPEVMAEHFGRTLAKIVVSCVEEEPSRKFLLEGKMLMVVADVASRYVAGKPVGYISGVVSHDVQQLPGMAEAFTPSQKVLAMGDWEERWLELTRHASRENVTMSCSTPPILLSYFKKVISEYRPLLGLPDTIPTIWPNLELITGAGVRMSLYRKQYQKLLGDQVCCREFYCATEGFFAYQKDEREGLTPILNHVFYEFIPLDEWNQMEEPHNYKTHPLTRLSYTRVSLNTDYVLAVTTPGGLYSYIIGDIVRFIGPDRLFWVGRLGWESSVAGEKFNEMHMSMLRQSMESTLGVEITNHMAAVKDDPLRYVFAFEFEESIDVNTVVETVDRSLREVNAIYDDLRKKNVLKCPDIVALQKGTFDRYIKRKQKEEKSLGQIKPPLFADSALIDELAED